ncbi:hypothetical protein MBLNU457_1171t1 [Dothideomycetes sp. NU457]
MLIRIDSEPFEIEEGVYEFISRANSDTYEPTSSNDPEKFPTVTRTSTLQNGSEAISVGQGGIFLHIENHGAPATPPAGPIMSPRNGVLSPSAETTTFGLPKDWVILPLSKKGPLARKPSINITLGKDDTLLDKQDSFSGHIDIDWDDPINPVKFNTKSHEELDKQSAEGLHEDDQSKTKPIDLHPICFSIVEDEINPSSYFGVHNAELLSDEQIRDARREARHHIRVVTRNSIGLVASVALSTVAPQLLIAAAINAYCLTQGSRHLYHHSHYLKAHGISIRKCDVTIAVIEGTALKLALLLLTVGHDDFLVFSNTWFGVAAKPITQFHDVIFGHNIILGDPAAWFVKPAEYIQEHLGIATAGERVAGAMMGGWSEPSHLLLENVFEVGAVQGGMEVGLARVEDHVGHVHEKVRSAMDKVRGRIMHPREHEAKEKDKALQVVAEKPSLKGRRSWSDSAVHTLKKKAKPSSASDATA